MKQATILVGQTEVRAYPMAQNCIIAGHCLGLATNCKLFPVEQGLCRERLVIIRFDEIDYFGYQNDQVAQTA